MNLKLSALMATAIMLLCISKAYTLEGSRRVVVGGQWSVSMDFNQSEILGFSFRPDGDWSLYSYLMYSVNLSGELLSIKYLEACVESSQLKKTTVRIPLVIDLNKGPTGVTVYPDYYEIFNQTSYDWIKINPKRGFNDPNGSITIEKGYPKVDEILGDIVFQLGKVSAAGQHNLTCALDPEMVNDETWGGNGTVPWIHRATAPPYLALYSTVLDVTGPPIETPIQTPSGTVNSGQEVKISANITDASSGVKQAILLYTTDNGSSWETPRQMIYNPETDYYETTIPGQQACLVKYEILACDNAGNYRVEDNAGEYYAYSVVSNTPPFWAQWWFLATIMTIAFIVAASFPFLRRHRKNTP